MVGIFGKISDFFSSVGKPSRDLGEGDRREFERYASDKACSVQYGDTQVESQLRDVSISGAWVESKIDASAGTEMDVVIFSLDRSFDAEIVRVDEGGTRVRFLLEEGDEDALEAFIALVAAGDGDAREQTPPGE